MAQTIQVFPRSFSIGDTPNVVAVLYTDEEDLDGAAAVADLYRLEQEEPVAADIEAEADGSEPGALRLICRIPSEATAELEPGVYFLRFRVVFDGGNSLTIPPDDRLRLRVR